MSPRQTVGPSIAIGVHVHAQPERLRSTLSSLYAHTALPFRLLLLGDGADEPTRLALQELLSIDQSSTGQPQGVAACFNRLVRHSAADFYVLLESGTQFGDRWLELLISAIQRDRDCGLAGPSTNRAWNQQCLLPSESESEKEVANLARMAAQRCGTNCRTLEPLYSLAEFCYVVRREVVESVGEADEAYGLGPCWEMDYNIRAHRAGFAGLWVCASYVHRAPPTERRAKEEAERFEASKRHYQDKFCGLRLRGLKQDYRIHCNGGACPNFAPARLITISTKLATPSAAVAAEPRPVSHTDTPLISCIMPTWNRRAFIPKALACFLAQDYPHLEMLVVDDGTDSIKGLLPSDERIRYFRLEQKLNIGAKRNFACSHASGEIIAHWDDDEWYPASRIRRQVEALLCSGAKVTGSSTNYFYQEEAHRAYRYAYSGPAGAWLAALLYRKSVWDENPFEPVTVAEDVKFLAKISPTDQLDLRDPALTVGWIHPGNTSRKITNGPYWKAESVEKVLALMRNGEIDPSLGQQRNLPLVSCIMPTFNRRGLIPLSLSCFHAQTYPSKELVVVDDGSDPVVDVLQDQPDVRYERVPSRMTIGGKRNLACARARGEFIAHWDDDDWYSPDRLMEQISPMLSKGYDVTGLTASSILQMPEGTFWTISPELHRRMFVGDIHGGTLAYRRSIWEHGIRYPEVNIAEDAGFLQRTIGTRKRIMRMQSPDLFVYVRHGINTWRFESGQFIDPRGWSLVSSPSNFPEGLLDEYRSAHLAFGG